MNHFSLRKKMLIFISVVVMLSTICFSIIGFYTEKAYAEEPAELCRLNVYYLYGVKCYDCYVAPKPPGWGCVQCPWTTC